MQHIDGLLGLLATLKGEKMMVGAVARLGRCHIDANQGGIVRSENQFVVLAP